MIISSLMVIIVIIIKNIRKAVNSADIFYSGINSSV